MLNEARMGICSPRSTRMFASLEREVTYTDGIQATELVSDGNAQMLEWKGAQLTL